MVTEIKRVLFFDGQFLKELEFQDEQVYHMHLRRRMNFFLFGQSGVVVLNPDDLKFFNPNVANKTFQVRAGMAICRRLTDMEGKEAVLFTDSPPIDLDTEGIVAGGTGFVTLNYAEVEAMDPPSEGDVSKNTRVKEQAVIDVHAALPPALAPNGEEYILLGTIAYDTMAFDYSARHEAKLRASLVGAVAPAVPTITGLTGTTASPAGGPPVNAIITGTNLNTVTGITFSDPLVTAALGAATPTSLAITITVGAAAAAGGKSFTLASSAGNANSPPGIFTVGAAPTLLSIAISAPLAALPLPGGITQFTATGTFSSGPTQDITGLVTWNSSTPGVATITAGGLANAVALGDTNITATQGAIAAPAFALVVGAPVLGAWPTVNDRRRNGGQTLTVFGTRFVAPMSVIFLGPNVADPDVVVSATVLNQTTAEVVVPGPSIPTLGTPVLVRSGALRATTTGGTSAPGPQAFILNII